MVCAGILLARRRNSDKVQHRPVPVPVMHLGCPLQHDGLLRQAPAICSTLRPSGPGPQDREMPAKPGYNDTIGTIWTSRSAYR